MSYLDNNPFNRPSPNFASNINTFNTYSSYNYLASTPKPNVYNNYGSNVGYGSSGNATTGYSGFNLKG